jgi:SAM-dependent methyltransferase
MTNYDFDVVIWDTIGGAYTSESMNRASGASEQEVVQVSEALAKRGFRVLCLNKTDTTRHWGSVHWDNPSNAYAVRCKTLIIQRYSTIPGSSQVLPDRMVVRAHDIYGPYHDHLSALTHLCVTEWSAQKFRAGGFHAKVIHPMLDDDCYDLVSTPKVKGRFIYGSAPMKGLNETRQKWASLKRRFPEEMEHCELHVMTPGYGKLSTMEYFESSIENSIKLLGDKSPREFAKYMATCEGLFYVNTFPETFCVVAAIANAVGCRVHVLAKNGISGIEEAVNGFLTEQEDNFDATFLAGLRGFLQIPPPKDYRVSTVMPKWLDALHLVDLKEEASHALFGRPYASLLKSTPGSVPIDIPSTTIEVPAALQEGLASAQRGEVAPWGELKTATAKATPTVCLVMLAKNAEPTIRRALESVKGFVDYACFQFDDKESSQGMRQLIVDLWPSHETSIPVEFTYEPWETFSVNRNKLLAAAREAFPHATYVLTLDADDSFVGLNEFDKSKLILDCYDIEIHDYNGAWRYARPMLWRADAGYYFKGPAHEFLTTYKPWKTSGLLPDVHYVRQGGLPLTTEQTREKYLRDVRLFTAELRKHPDDTRSTYYLAQSLEDAACGNDDELLHRALRVYEKRAAMAGYQEEKFLAWMKVGRFRVRFKEGAERVVDAFTRAALVIPARAMEAAYEVLLYHNQPENPSASYERGLQFASSHVFGFDHPELLSREPAKGFIVDISVYQWRYEMQLALALFYTGSKVKAKALFENLLTTAPPEQHAVLRANLTFCEPPVVVEDSLLDELENAYGKVPEVLEIKKVDGPITLVDVPPSNPPMGGKVDRLVELEGAYKALNVPHSFWTTHAHRIDVEKFRGHFQYLSQSDSFPYTAIVDWINEHLFARGFYDELKEDDAFECVTTTIDGKIVSRDLLDSVMELDFLATILGGRLELANVLDIGAGYGRFAHRLATLPGDGKIYTTDAVPISTVVCEKYIAFRGLKNVVSVPLHELDALPHIDLAVNIHSWSECTLESIEWWLDLLVQKNVRFLFVVPHSQGFETDGPEGGPSFRPAIEARGYKLIAKRILDFGGDSGAYFHHLFERL